MAAKQYVNYDGISVYDEEIKAYIDEQGFVKGAGNGNNLAKFDSNGEIANGPSLGDSTTTYLRNDGVWAIPPGTGGLSSIGDISDVNIESPTEGQALIYDADDNEWVNRDIASIAQDISYDNTNSTLSSTNVQGAIDEINSPTFTEAETRVNITGGEKLSILFGKIKKFFTDLKTVAFTGSYDDLSNKPTIPTKTSGLTNDSDFVSDASYVHTDNNYTTDEKNKLSGIATGAEVNVQSDWSATDTTSDAYIKNKPTIPTVNNGTLTIQKNGTNVQTFSANQSENATANITVPTKVSELTNDSGYTTNKGSVTSVATGAGLTGGTITGSGTIKADLKSETKSALTAADKGSTASREYAVGLDANGKLSVNVPWTDTHWTTHLYAGTSSGADNAATTNGNTYLMVLDNTTVRDRRLIKGTGGTTVTSDASGNITINSAATAGPTTLSASLDANATTLSFTDTAIGDNTRFDVYTSVYGVNPTDMAQSSTTLTLTFSSSHDAATIQVHCWNT